MNKYRVIGAYVSVSSGIVELTKAQAGARGYALTDLKKPGELIEGTGQYAVEKQTGFKLGEVFGWDEEANKALAQVIVDADAPVAEVPSTGKKKAPAKPRGKK